VESGLTWTRPPTESLRGAKMRTRPEYRTVILELEPTWEQKSTLLKIEERAAKFIEGGRLRLQKELYHRFKGGIPSRTLALLSKRFTGSMGNKGIIPFDGDNSRFVEDGAWWIEVQLGKRGDKRERILAAKTDVPYYDDIKAMTSFPFFIARDNDRWFAYISIPLKKVERKPKIVGIDLNLGKWVAAEETGRPHIFRVSDFEREVEHYSRLIRWLNREKKDASDEFKSRRDAMIRTHTVFLDELEKRWGICTLAVENVKVMYKLPENRNRLINNWLYTKTAIGRFIMAAMIRGFEVIEVNPYNTSKACHRCGNLVIEKGRLITCPTPGCLVDYNRDVNAARMMAIRVKRPRWGIPSPRLKAGGKPPAYVSAGVGEIRERRNIGMSDIASVTGTVKPPPDGGGVRQTEPQLQRGMQI